MNEWLFTKFEALAYDEGLIVPSYAEVVPGQADVRDQLTANNR